MQDTSENLESAGLVNEQAPKKRKPAKIKSEAQKSITPKKEKTPKVKSEAQKLIPPKKGTGRKTAELEKSTDWIVAAAESLYAKPKEEIPPVICLPCLDIKDIKLEEKVEKTLEVPASAFTRPPTPASTPKLQGTVMGVTVTPLKRSSTASVSVPKSPEPTTQVGLDLDKDLVTWMKMAFKKYITLAGQKSNSGHTWGHRMAQVAVGLDVMTSGMRRTKEIFPHFVGALFALMDAARSTKDLDLLEYLLKNSVYLDVLAEAAAFQAKSGTVSVNFQNHYEDKYLALSAADGSISGRAGS